VYLFLLKKSGISYVTVTNYGYSFIIYMMTVSGYVCRALGMPKLKCHQRRTRREQVYAYYWSLFMHIMPEM